MESAQALTAAEPVVFKKRSAKSNFRKRPATPPPAGVDADSSAYSSSEDEAGHKVKRRKKNTGIITATSKTNATSNAELTSTVYTAERNATIKSVNDATKQSNWYDENATDVLSPKNLLGSTRAIPSEASVPDGTYKGLANLTTFIQKNPNAPT